MKEAHADAGARASGQSIHWPQVITWVSLGILVGTEVVGMIFAAAWAVGGLMELGPTLQYALYAVALASSVAVMVPFMRHAARVEPLRGSTEEHP
ncbi:hypothetical protein [Microvirga massiliensis]|uniref:hypothetical protein n=1 Tax=Microvirga massiliensis TaxID=1033741 RepID=UPI00062BBE07|nr:hypothetical protein [Microvirga massiliensis]